MATKKTGNAKGAVAKKAVAKKAPVKKPEGKKVAVKKAVPKKAAKADAGCAFHLYDEGQKKFVPAEQAKAVKIEGFDAFSFFLHKSADGEGWTISEVTSGARIAVGRTQAEVKAKAAEALSKHGAADLAESIRRTIAKNGAAPGYEAAHQKAPQVTTRLKSRILAALVDDKKLPKLKVQFDEIVKATGAAVGDVAAALMVLELNRAVKSLPGKFYRLAKADEQKLSGNRGGKPRGKMSMLDAAVEILKGAKEPITVKEITRAIFEKDLAASNGRTPHATLSAAMGREIAGKGARSRFRRADRGRFALNA